MVPCCWRKFFRIFSDFCIMGFWRWSCSSLEVEGANGSEWTPDLKKGKTELNKNSEKPELENMSSRNFRTFELRTQFWPNFRNWHQFTPKVIKDFILTQTFQFRRKTQNLATLVERTSTRCPGRYGQVNSKIYST